MTYRILLITWLFLVTIGIVHARWRDHDYPADWEPPPEYQDSNSGLDGVVTDLRHRREGRVLSSDTFEENGRPVHRIRILNDDGRVRPLHFDGTTGLPLPRYRDYPYGEPP